MTISIDLRPDEERALLERARLSGRDPVQYVQNLVRDHIQAVAPDDVELIDHEFIAYCQREADDSVTLEEVRTSTAKIKDSMARVIIEEERADRF